MKYEETEKEGKKGRVSMERSENGTKKRSSDGLTIDRADRSPAVAMVRSSG